MWELIARIFPPPLIMGTLIYALICAIWLQPIIEERMANITFAPQCEAGDLPTVRSTPHHEASEDDTLSLSQDAPTSVLLVRELRLLFGSDTHDARPRRYASADTCTCSVGVAFDEVFWRSLLHVMTVRFLTPEAIENFDLRVARIHASGLCG